MTKIANLEVILDENAPNVSALETVDYRVNKEFRLVINPKLDKKSLTELGLPTGKKQFESILAHELGHFVGFLLKDESHSREAHFTHRSLGEAYAWNIAHKMGIPLDAELENKVLTTYKQADEAGIPQMEGVMEYLRHMGRIR